MTETGKAGRAVRKSGRTGGKGTENLRTADCTSECTMDCPTVCTAKRTADCTAFIELEYRSAAEAKLVDKATMQDNEGFVETRVAGSCVVATVSGKSAASLLHTIDDYLECVAVAERMFSVNKCH